MSKDAELFDVWATPEVEVSKKAKEYRNFAENQMTKVKAVMQPEGGQSFNPSAAAHVASLKKIVTREAEDLEKKLRLSYENQIKQAKLN